MPLALLLSDQLRVLTRGVARLGRWEGATETFRLVVSRLRSAYLVRWFGPGLPVEGLELKVTFVNLGELRARWLAVTSGAPAAPGQGPNLLEPLLGMGGTLVGTLAAPLNSMLLGAVVTTLTRRWWVVLLGAVNWLAWGLLGTVAFSLVGGLGGLLLLALLPGIAAEGQLRAAYNVLGAVAELAVPLQRFWAVVSGPREAVRHPLLRQVLVLGDRLAGLFALLLGAFAVLVARVGPLLEPTVRGVLAVEGLARELGALVGIALGGVVDLLGLLFERVPDVLDRVLASLGRTLARVGTGLGRLWREIHGALRRFASESGRLLSAWWLAQGRPFVRSQTVDHPTVRYLRSFLGGVAVAGAWSGRRSPSRPSSPSPPGRIEQLIRRLLRVPTTTPRLPAVPSLPPTVPWSAIPVLAGLAGVLPAIAVPARGSFELSAQALAALGRARRPPSVFAGQRAALAAQAAEPEARARALEAAAYLSLAERVVSPEAGKAVRQLEGALSRLDLEIRKAPAQPRHPVRDLAAPLELRPVIGTLRVRARGHTREALDGWVAELRRQLEAAPYPAPGGG